MAGEIYIADKVTLDEVKQDTNFIKQQFPVSGGTDWTRYSCMVYEQNTINTGWTKVIEVNGAGVLKYISTIITSSFGSGTKGIKITVDSYKTFELQGTGVYPLNIFFNSYLKVELYYIASATIIYGIKI